MAPDVLLLANLGAVRLNYGCGVDECRGAMQIGGVNALVPHLNPMHEALQGGGNINFAGLRTKLTAVAAKIPVLPQAGALWQTRGAGGRAVLYLADEEPLGVSPAHRRAEHGRRIHHIRG